MKGIKIGKIREELNMDEEKKTVVNPKTEKKNGPESDHWATEALQEMDDFIESQGIYIRQ